MSEHESDLEEIAEAELPPGSPITSRRLDDMLNDSNIFKSPKEERPSSAVDRRHQSQLPEDEDAMFESDEDAVFHPPTSL